MESLLDECRAFAPAFRDERKDDSGKLDRLGTATCSCDLCTHLLPFRYLDLSPINLLSHAWSERKDVLRNYAFDEDQQPRVPDVSRSYYMSMIDLLSDEAHLRYVLARVSKELGTAQLLVLDDVSDHHLDLVSCLIAQAPDLRLLPIRCEQCPARFVKWHSMSWEAWQTVSEEERPRTPQYLGISATGRKSFTLSTLELARQRQQSFWVELYRPYEKVRPLMTWLAKALN